MRLLLFCLALQVIHFCCGKEAATLFIQIDTQAFISDITFKQVQHIFRAKHLFPVMPDSYSEKSC